MVTDQLRVPRLAEPLSAGEYAKLEGLDEMSVLEAAFHGRLPGVYLRGWYLEAPPYSEERVSRLRGQSTLEPRLANWLRLHVALRDDAQYDSERERLRVKLVKSHWRYDILTPAQQQALLSTTQYAKRPQPIDYGLSRGDFCLHPGSRSSLNNELTYAKEQRGLGQFFLGYSRRRSRPAYLKYAEALGLHELYQSAAQAAAHEAEQTLIRKKRSYWEFVDGYEFERATAEVLRKHQFTATVTRGSGDGGIDIEVSRNGLKGVVQCKSHVACVGPHVVRDLYGVIHHSGAAFGVIVSRGGFTRGASEFARDKPIYFVDTDDLIAMQEGKDVLAAAFDDQQ